MQVKLESFRKFESGNLKGFGSVTLEDGDTAITLNDLRLMTKTGEYGEFFFIGFPSSEYKDKNGTKKYKPFVRVDKTLAKKITEVLATEYNKSTEKDKGSTTTKEKEKEPFDDTELPF